MTVATLFALPLPAQAQIAVWSSTLTVRDLGNNVLGCAIHIANGSCSAYLGNDTFTHYGRTYGFLIISLHPNGDLVTSFNRNLANNTRDLTLNVDGKGLRLRKRQQPEPNHQKVEQFRAELGHSRHRLPHADGPRQARDSRATVSRGDERIEHQPGRGLGGTRERRPLHRI